MTARQDRLQRLIVAASEQPTDWLIANVLDSKPVTIGIRLSMIACLRIIVGRTDTSGLPYRPRMTAVKRRLFAGNSNRMSRAAARGDPAT